MSFMEIFQPGLRHLREERDRQRLMVAKPPAAGPAPLGIDLDAGTAVIPGPSTPDDESTTGSERPGPPAEGLDPNPAP